ncbi:hypothetical protein BDV93DRAFT_525822 [Ceratobasidium sp. AG-I]|nr:hypothetical protein BDV93DRAFT_525822 [Ceratobasidium sp. AG-I]
MAIHMNRYLLYGIPGTPVAWLGWDRVAHLQHDEIEKKSLWNAAPKAIFQVMFRRSRTRK